MGKKRSGRRNNGRPERKNSNQSLTVLICVLAAVCLIAGGIYIDTFHGKGMFLSMMGKGGQTGEQPRQEVSALSGHMEIDISSKASVAVFGEEFMLCTKDGVKYFASMGDQLWSDTFNMTSPVIVQEGEYVAVGDIGGKTVRVYHKEGMLYDLQTEGSPVQFALNQQGYLSLITKSEDTYRIRVYNAKGTLLKERVEESSGIYPLSSDVSDDSRVFSVSYLDTTDISPVGRVVLFYIDAEESEEHTDSMFAGVEKTDEIIPVISYMANGTLAVISDQNIYGIGSSGEELWSYGLENTVDQAALGNKEYIVLALGDSVADKDGREKGTVCWLNDSGKEKASVETGDSVTYLCAAEKGVVIGNDSAYTGTNHSGSVGWEYTAVGDMSEMIPMEKLNQVMMVGKEQIAVYDMSKLKNSKNTEAVPVDEEEEASAEEKENTEEKENIKEETDKKNDKEAKETVKKEAEALSAEQKKEAANSAEE